MERSKHARNLEKVIWSDLWPQRGQCVDPEADTRHMAIAEVLRRIPEPDYQWLLDHADRFLWFIPSYAVGAMVYPFHWTTIERGLKSYAAVLFLSPSMESWGFDVIVAAVAHELAHLRLKHKLRAQNEEEYDAQEKKAWSLVRKWGFEEEERKHEAFYRKRARREEMKIAALEKQIRTVSSKRGT